MSRERLLALSDLDHSFSYAVEHSSAMPLAGYVSTFRLRSITDGDRTFAEWRGQFESTDPHSDLPATIEHVVYDAGFAGICARLAELGYPVRQSDVKLIGPRGTEAPSRNR